MGADVAAGVRVFEMFEERGVHRHHVFEVPVLRAVLDHQDLAVALDDGRLDLANLFVEQHLVVALAVEDLLARFADARRAQRVGLARPAERRLHLLPGLLNRLVGPLGREGLGPLHRIERIEYDPRTPGRDREPLLDVLDRLMHMPPQQSSRRCVRGAVPTRTPIHQKNIGAPILPGGKFSLMGDLWGERASGGVDWHHRRAEFQALTCCVRMDLADRSCHARRKPSRMPTAAA